MTPILAVAAVQAIYLAMALSGSYVVFRFLKGTAQIKRKDVQLGGSAAMFVVLFVLLNHYGAKSRENLLCDVALSETEQAAQTVTRISPTGRKNVVEVSFSPATQLISSRNLGAIDRNEYYVDEDLRVAVKKPRDAGWTIKRSDAVQAIGISDIPSFDFMFASMSVPNIKTRPMILAVTRSTSHTVRLSKDSQLESIPMNFNMYKIPEIQEYLIRQAFEIGRAGSISDNEFNRSISLFTPSNEYITNRYQSVIDSRLPIEKCIYNALYIVIFDEIFLKNVTINQMFPRRSILDLAMNYLWISKDFALGSMSNVYVNHVQNLISFNGSVELKDVELDGKKTDVLVNNVGFLTMVSGKVAFVQLIVLSSEPVEIFKILKGTLESMRLAS